MEKARARDEAESGRPSNRVDHHARIARWLDRHANANATPDADAAADAAAETSAQAPRSREAA